MTTAGDLFWQRVRQVKLEVFDGCRTQADVDERIELYIHALRKAGVRVKVRGTAKLLASGEHLLVETEGWVLTQIPPERNQPS